MPVVRENFLSTAVGGCESARGNDDEPTGLANNKFSTTTFLDGKHIGGELIDEQREHHRPTETWRMKERMKTVSVALTLCLNIGVDPPDIVKPQPCARLECWLDPMAMSQQKALEMIGAALQKQYERWQPRARYKVSLDPTVEDVKKLCMSLRRNAKDERVLFHYNGHGVPKPTKNGEIWVFNERYTQYIPLSIYDLQTWMGTPSIFVWDCNCAGLVIECFRQFAEQHERQHKRDACAAADAEYQYHQKTGGATQNGAIVVNNQTIGARKISNEISIGPEQPPLQPPQPAVAEQNPAAAPGEFPSNSGAGATANATAAPSAASTSAGSFAAPNFKDCIQLGACRMDQILPANPELPSDLFTSCLTTPIKVAVLWYILQNNLMDKLPLDIIDKIPGQLQDRRTLLGELNWILTAITDTIAWNTLPRQLFQTLFRQDLLVASLFRNFLLADRVMRSYHCTPISHPQLPSTAEHPMWQAWDSVLDVCLSQLPMYIARPDAPTPVLQPVPSIPLSQSSNALSEAGGCEYTHSSFFAHQLTAFEVWLEYGYEHRAPPQQLPIVLQVLLSQVHRVRALELLGRFLDLGPWAVSLALSVGIFPYVLKLLQSFAKDLRPLLSFIWAKILAVDPSCQCDLIKDGGHRYFLQILSDPSVSGEQKIVPAFVLASILDDYPAGREAIMQGGYMSICMELFNDCRSALLRQWLAIGLGRLWSDFDAARWQAIRCVAYEKLFELLDDPMAEVRGSAVFALGTLISNRTDQQNEHAVHTDHSITMQLVAKLRVDPSPLVRKELIVALHWFVLNFENQFVAIAYEAYELQMNMVFEEQRQRQMKDHSRLQQQQSNGSVAHMRQSSLSVVDNCYMPDGITQGYDIRRQSSMQNLATSPSMASPGAAISSATFTKLHGLAFSPTTPTTTPRSSVGGGGGGSVVSGGCAVLPSPSHHDPVLVLENRLRNLLRCAGTQSNVYATVWRTLLTFANEPCADVASLAANVVEHVDNEALQLRRANAESEDNVADLQQQPQRYLQSLQRRSVTAGGGKGTLETNHHAALSSDGAHGGGPASELYSNTAAAISRATFVVGSPSDGAAVLAASPSSATTPGGHTATAAVSANTPNRIVQSKSIASINVAQAPPPPMPLYSTIFPCPKRGVFGDGPFAPKESDSHRPSHRKLPLIKTEFIACCAKQFTRPILHLLNDDETARDEPGKSTMD